MTGDQLNKELDRFENTFKYHPPQGDQQQRYELIRQCAHGFAKILAQSCPYSREYSLAITKIEEAVMMANAAIARNE